MKILVKNISHSLTNLERFDNSYFGQFDTKATPIESISVKDGFEVELLFTVQGEAGFMGQSLPRRQKPYHR